MKLFFPEYYHQFRCLAGECPDSCCKEWDVDVDAGAATYYRSLPGILGDRLRQVLKETDDGTVMVLQQGRCPMWQEDGLCWIQKELGHDALCQVCREFPRLRHDYGDFMELGLELSCPEAARLILTGSPDLLTEEIPDGSEGAYDMEAMEILQNSREKILTFLRDTSYSVPQMLAVLLLYGHSVQGWLDGGEEPELDAEGCLVLGNRYAESANYEDILPFFEQLEILTPQWKERLAAGIHATTWTQLHRNFIFYGIQRYWLQAVSDYDLIARVKFIIISCLLIRGLGGDTIETAQLFSKEIENDPENVDAILDGAYTYAAFSDVKLLGLLPL